jgi:hypothetical protein
MLTPTTPPPMITVLTRSFNGRRSSPQDASTALDDLKKKIERHSDECFFAKAGKNICHRYFSSDLRLRLLIVKMLIIKFTFVPSAFLMFEWTVNLQSTNFLFVPNQLPPVAT